MAEEEKEEQKKPKGNLVLIIVISLLVLLLGIGGLVAFLLIGNDTPDAPPVNSQQPASQGSTAQKRSSSFLTVGPIYPMDQFIVNLLSESGSRFLKVTMQLELNNDSLATEMETKKSLVRDIIITILSSKTFEEVSTVKGKNRLKDEIVSKLNEVLTDGYVKNVFFTDFVVQ